MNNEDYLGIIALALSDLAETVASSTSPHDVRPLLMERLMDASIRWGADANLGSEATEIKGRLVNDVKESIDEVQKWRAKYKAKVAAGNN